jgi:hypothetical protein
LYNFGGLGDGWLWSESNVVTNRLDPSSKKEVIDILKNQMQRDPIKDKFDKSFQNNDPSFMSNVF